MREYGSEHQAILLPDGYFDSFQQYGSCAWLRSGREALHLVALSIKRDKQNPKVLMPAYCCHSMMDPFIKAGWDVAFYPLLTDLSVDTASLQMLLYSVQPDAVLVMNYFGSTATNEAVSCIKVFSANCICIEDFSHCTFSFPYIYNPKVDFYVSSIRKSVGVCDGAVVISHYSLNESIIHDNESAFVDERRESQLQKERYLFTQNAEEKKEFLSRLQAQEAVLDRFVYVHRISGFGKAQLSSINGGAIRFARITNMKHMLAVLGGKIESIPGIERCLNNAPFSFPIIVNNRDTIQKRLAQAGVYAPVLWPIPSKARARCSVSARMSDQMLSIPIDQRYNYDDIEDIARIVLENCI